MTPTVTLMLSTVPGNGDLVAPMAWVSPCGDGTTVGVTALVGMKDIHTGDSLTDEHHPVILENIVFPEPVIQIAIEPKTKDDEEKLMNALTKLADEDPTFQVKEDSESGQTLISGMGELLKQLFLDRRLQDDE